MDLKENAKEFAIKAHKEQIRKLNGKFFIYHPLGVGEILESFGYNDDIIIAGYLHDTVEDTDVTIDNIKEIFGDRVAELVSNASELDKSLSWEERKTHTINFVKEKPLEEIAVIIADKIHNIEDLTNEIRVQGLSVFDSFKRGIKDQFWYFEGIYNSVIISNSEVPIVGRLKMAIQNLKNEIEFQSNKKE